MPGTNIQIYLIFLNLINFFSYIIVDHTVQTIDLVKIFKPQSDILQQPDGSASFKRVNTVYDIHNRVVEYTLSYSLADKFKFVFD